MEYEELIQKHFNNSLSKEETTVFTQLLKENEAFKYVYDEYKDLQIALKHNEKQHLKTYLNTVDQKTLPFHKKILNNKSILIAIASCLIITIFYVVSLNSNNLYDNYYSSYPNVYQPTVRGNNTNETAKAFQAYENRNYAKAAQLFKSLLEVRNDNNLLFYYAMSLLNQNKISEADTILQKLKTKEHNFLAEVYWYSALIAIKNKNNSSAILDLTEVKKKNKDFKTKEVLELLKKLKE